MKRRPVRIAVSDHAMLRFLDRNFGLDVGAVRRHIAGKVRDGAEMGAVAVCVDKVKFVLRDLEMPAPEHVATVLVVTAAERRMLITNHRRPEDEAGDE